MRLVRAAITAGLAAACVLSGPLDSGAQTDRAGVVKTYADIGQATYEDALARARLLQKAVRALVETPSEATLQAAREAWLSAREPYMQTAQRPDHMPAVGVRRRCSVGQPPGRRAA